MHLVNLDFRDNWIIDLYQWHIDPIMLIIRFRLLKTWLVLWEIYLQPLKYLDIWIQIFNRESIIELEIPTIRSDIQLSKGTQNELPNWYLESFRILVREAQNPGFGPSRTKKSTKRDPIWTYFTHFDLNLDPKRASNPYFGPFWKPFCPTYTLAWKPQRAPKWTLWGQIGARITVLTWPPPVSLFQHTFKIKCNIDMDIDIHILLMLTLNMMMPSLRLTSMLGFTCDYWPPPYSPSTCSSPRLVYRGLY